MMHKKDPKAYLKFKSPADKIETKADKVLEGYNSMLQIKSTELK